MPFVSRAEALNKNPSEARSFEGFLFKMRPRRENPRLQRAASSSSVRGFQGIARGTAAVFGAELDRHVICARSTVALQRGDVAVVGQYVGPRLPEGATQLPEGARIEWRRVEWS